MKRITSLKAACSGLLRIIGMGLVECFCCPGILHAGSENRLDLFLQPWSILEQNDSWRGFGSYEIGIHRIKSTLLSAQDIGSIRASGMFGVNWAELEIQNAWVAFACKPYIEFKAGKFKIPFGANNLIEDSRLPTIHRSFTSLNLQYLLLVAGYRTGAMVSGSVADWVDYSLCTFQYPPNNLPGTGKSDLYRLPVGRICLHPYRMIDIEYMISAPAMARIGSNGAVLSKRLFLHDVALHGRFADWYQGFFELFIGVDTADIARIQEIWSPYTDNVAYSLYTSHTVAIPLPWNLLLKCTTVGEFLNGLNYLYAEYVDRPFYYALAQCVRLELSRDASMEMSYDTRFGRRFEPFRFQRLSAQINYGASMKMMAGPD